jgi:hypothetical protein
MTSDEMYSLIQNIIRTERQASCLEEGECKFFKPRTVIGEGKATLFIDIVQKAVGAKDLVQLSDILSGCKRRPSHEAR